ncbi:MAG: HAD-IC family P-type ATPase [Candidatus Diapherotrites archaeon]
MDYFLLSEEELFQQLNSSRNGLVQEEAEKRLIEFGKNKLKEKKDFSVLKIFLNQFTSVLVLILFVAGGISFLLGEQLDAFAIFAIIVLNAVIGFIQEFKAENALSALKKMVSLDAVVLRNGKKQKIPAENLVPGDLIFLDAGDKAPADARLIESFSLKVDESILTGESNSVLKNSEELTEDLPLAKRINLVYSNTIITEGHALAIVTSTGMNTEFGKIAEMISDSKEKKTILNTELDWLAKNLGIAIIGILFVLFLIGLFRGINLFEMFMISVSLGVSAIPEGLPIIVTITLALGVQQMAKRKAIVRKISVIESLGAATVICSDKTGTLTLNEMTARKIFVDGKEIDVKGVGYDAVEELNYEGESFEKMLWACENCNNSFIEFDENKKALSFVGDSTEVSLKVLTKKANMITQFKKISEIPFSSERKKMSSLHEINGKKIVLMKGALEEVIERSTHLLINGKKINLTEEKRNELISVQEKWAGKALRVLGFAFKETDEIEYAEDEMVFLGLIGLMDPPRPEARESIQTALSAGIEVKIITGDNALTAKAVAKELGLKQLTVVEGSELDSMNENEFSECVKSNVIFARTDPKHKLMIVQALQRQGHVVAVTGDGVNDAPALKNADIGIAMGIKGTEVSKEASDIVLSDDNFSSIVSAIEEGRRIYKNIQAFIKFLLSANFAAIAVVGIISIVGLPLPLLPLQILWINIATDALPALALANERPENLMNEKPRKRNESLFSKFLFFIFVSTFVYVICSLAFFWYGFEKDFSFGINPFDLTQPSHARTLVFSGMVFFEMFLVFNCRRENKTVFELNPLKNKFLILAVLISFGLQLLIIYHPFAQEIFKTVALSAWELIVLILISMTALFVPYAVRLIEKLRN